MAANGKDAGSGNTAQRRERNLEAYRELERTAYAEHNFLHFGIEEGYSSMLDIEGTAELLSLFDGDVFSHGMADMDRPINAIRDLIPEDAHFCDFCGRLLVGGQYERLADGRERCTPCTRSVIHSATEVKTLFRSVKRQMEISFGIAFESPIDASVVSARKLHARLGESYTPTPNYDNRTIGFVVKQHGKQELWLENGCPRCMLMSTMAHELTHVWQNQFAYFRKLPKRVSHERYLLIVEGMATWTEAQLLKLVHEEDYAQVKLDEYHRRTDVYGEGFRLYEKRYGFSEGGSIVRDHPFRHPDGPL